MSGDTLSSDTMSREALPGEALPGARPDLQPRVRQVACRARGLVRLYGLGWFVTLVGLVALGLGLIDYLVRFQDVGVRLICFAGVWCVVAWGGVRYLFSAWRYRCSDLHAAQRIERRFPALGDLLSSAVAFCTQAAGDETAGSCELRRTVITQAEVAVEPMDFSECLDRRPSIRAWCVAGTVIGTILVLGLLDGPAVGLAAKRLLVPWVEHPWPRRHVLEFVVAPTRLAAGQDFEVELVDANGSLPDQVQIHYWFDGEDMAAIQTQAMQPLGQKLTHRLTNVTRGFFYRATGGDDQRMPWTEVQIVEPARVLVQEIHLAPPSYTGLASHAATGNFRTLRGTRVTLHVRVSKPLSSALLETNTTESERLIPLRLDADRRGCSLSHEDAETWEIRRSGSYGFRLVDQDGLDSAAGERSGTNGHDGASEHRGASDRWEVEAIEDAPPTVSLKHPAADMFLTAQAKLAVEAVIKDDLAIHSVALRFTRPAANEPGEQVVPLWNGPNRVTAESDVAASRENEGVQRTEQYAWDLSLLPQLEPGESLTFRVVATDYLPQDGPSATRRITILSAEDYEERIAQRQAEILAQIAEVARVQQQTHGQTAPLEIPLREIGKLGRDEVDQLQGAELNQRQVQQRLGHPNDGIGAQVTELIRELAGNRLDSSGTVERLKELRDGVGALNENALPRIEHRLIDALKLAREDLALRGTDGTGGDPGIRDPLRQLVREAAADQEEVFRSLEQMLGHLSQWDSYRQLAREVGRLRREQESVNQSTQSLRRETLSKDIQGLTDAQRVALLRVTEQQNDIALRFDALRGRMDVTRQGLAKDDPPAAATLVDAIEMVQRVGIGSGMRDAARGMENNRLSQASEQQGLVIQQLGELQDILANRRDQSPDQVAQRLGQLRQAVTELRDRQQRLWTETQQLVPPAPAATESATESAAAVVREAGARVATQQAVLAQDVVSLQQTVLDIESLAMALREAGAAAASAARTIQQPDTGAVAQTLGYQQEVVGILTRVLEALQDDPPPPPDPQDPPQNPPEEPAPPERNSASSPFQLMQLKLIHALQQELNDRTTRLEQQSRDTDGWNADRTRRQLDLTNRQGTLADLLGQLQNKDAPTEPTGTAGPSKGPLEDLERVLDGDPKQTPSAPDDPTSRENTLDRQLLDGLPGEPPPATQQLPDNAGQPPGAESPVLNPSTAGSDVQPAHSLERIGNRMREVAQRLAQRDLAEPTQAVQRQIVVELETLINEVTSQQQQQQRENQRRAPSEKTQGQDATDKQGQEAATGTPDGSPQDNAVGDGTGTVQRVVGSIWGHLPERYRRQVQNAGAVEFLPQYSKLIEDYYRRLSEDRDRRP
ncbi:MAG: hypothetical protein ACYC3X_10385 [Pirellulaceae bacterium]